MAGPLFGLGAQTQIPLTQQSAQAQAAQATQARNDQQRQAVTNETQPAGAEAAESQNAENSGANLFNLTQEDIFAAAERGRGALVDVVV